MEALPGEAWLPALPSPQLPPPPGLLLRSWDSLPAAKNAHGLPGQWGRTRGPHPSPSARILRALGGSSWGKLRPRGRGGGVRGPRAPGVLRSFGGCALVGSLHPPLFNRESVQGEAAGLGARVGVEGGVGRGPGRRPGRGEKPGPLSGLLPDACLPSILSPPSIPVILQKAAQQAPRVLGPRGAEGCSGRPEAPHPQAAGKRVLMGSGGRGAGPTRPFRKSKRFLCSFVLGCLAEW